VPKTIPPDATLIPAYAAMVDAWKLEHQPMTGPSSAMGDWIAGIENSILKPAGRAVIDGLLIIGGLIAVLVAVIIISKAGGRSSSAPAPVNNDAPAPVKRAEKAAGDTGDILTE
jgi:hypothetical protein